MPAGAGTRRYEKLELWFFAANSHGGFCHAPPPPQRGTSPRTTLAMTPTPFLRPRGGRAPRLAKSSAALHFLIPPSTVGLRLGRFCRWRAGIEVDWRAHPGSQSRACFRCSRSCRLGSAHQGMRSWSCGLVRRVGTADSATPHPTQAGDKPPHYIGYDPRAPSPPQRGTSPRTTLAMTPEPLHRPSGGQAPALHWL